MESMNTMVDGLIERARNAMNLIKDYNQEEVNRLVQSVAWAIYQDNHAIKLAELSVKDSGLGNVKDKITKNKRKTFGTLRDLLDSDAKSVGMINYDEEKGIMEFAKPVGVVAAVVPSTNPAATPANKTMMALKGKNAIIIAPSPKGASSCKLLLDYIYEEFDKINAPHDLVQMLPIPVSKEMTNELIAKVDLVTVTGSQRNVMNGQTCGTANVCVGKGNVVTIVDQSADLSKAAKLITMSKTFDHATSCSSDNAVVVEEAIYDEFLEQLKTEGAYICNESEKELLQYAMWDKETGKRQAKTTGQSVEVIANEAGIDLPEFENVRYFAVEENGVGKDYPYSGEKIAVVLAIYKVANFSEALSLTETILNYQGKGHSCGLHTTNSEHIKLIGARMPVCRIMINQAQAIGNGGSFNNGMNFTLSMGGGSWAKNNIGENLSYKHFINITKVAQLIPEKIPSEEELFGTYWSFVNNK